MFPKNQIHILAGASGAGKTTLILQLIEAWAIGAIPVIPALALDAKKIAYVAADRAQASLGERLNKIPNVQFYSLVDDKTFCLDWLRQGDIALRRVMDRLKPFDFLILDPIAPFLMGSLIDFRSVMISLIHISRVTLEREATTLATHHLTKARSDYQFLRPQDRISGSAAFHGYSGTQMILIEGKESGADCDTFVYSPHEEPPSEWKLRRAVDGGFIPYVTEDALATHAVQLISLLPKGRPLTITEISAAVDSLSLSRATLYRVLESLTNKGLLSRSGRGVYVSSTVSE